MNLGFNALIDGFRLINQKGIRRFVYLPILLNLFLFGGAFYWMWQQIDKISQFIVGWVPDWLAWLNFLVIPFMLVCFFALFIFLFTAISNFIAAPFHGLLAAKVEHKLNPQIANQAPSEFKLSSEISRTLKREWTKQLYFIPRAIGFFILFMLIPIVGQLVWFLFIAWMMAIQYCDFCFDNHQIDFHRMRTTLSKSKFVTFSFGGFVSLLSMLPLVNLIIMPAAVCGATKLWVERYFNDLD
ncbi:sulfate transport protein CysZ [Catenovulum agarivorans DS-2]|uniref:Sulfate transporter CysZ n=1 Tax=Catenovulum agarivorans DS-2 TaxID=1328313 RepID=W7QIW2_9ALTE|nr:sulfate transporter CysZ [Catenovulum agarivorans]EWH08877.1 sulfate transport protein CysZ [Catenovulum agarivorans DS-2]